MTTTYGKLPYCALNLAFLGCRPPPTAMSPALPKKPLKTIMHLVRCATPLEPLEDAPKTALLSDLTEGERWDGFWSSNSEAYYVRCTRVGGATEWFTLADEPAGASRPEARVIPLHPKRMQSRVSVVVARSPNGRRMLVGNAGRTSRQ